MNSKSSLANQSFSIEVSTDSDAIHVTLVELASGFAVIDGVMNFRVGRNHDGGSITHTSPTAIRLDQSPEGIRMSYRIAGLDIDHSFEIPPGTECIAEHIVAANNSDNTIETTDFLISHTRRITNSLGEILPEVANDRLAAIPFRHRASDPADYDADYSLGDLLRRNGREQRVPERPMSVPEYGHVPGRSFASEGWSWLHEGMSFCVWKFNQEGMEYSLLSMEADSQGANLCIGGAGVHAGDPSSASTLVPGASVKFGTTWYLAVTGGYEEAAYAFRSSLDSTGCRFPSGFNPPVHWNELYDNPEWHVRSALSSGTPSNSRPVTYTRELILEEARKARAYECEALYLDPGWDTEFGSFIWGEQWLGERRSLIEDLRSQYDLSISLHCPLATWMSLAAGAARNWPKESWQTDESGAEVENAVCLGSRQYLDVAADRLLDLCGDGVVFLMFDGNWWNGGCHNPEHGHPVPYTKEDHVRACLELAQRVHAEYPDVLIEMHDMISGGAVQRYTPVYYKYNLPGSYDENWGFELMWNPMEDIVSGRARSLYYYNLACNIPLYLHVDLREDNENCVVLWWYASTCRHLGIGGTHENHRVAEAQMQAMKRYRSMAALYKRGEFYGMHENAHVHVLPDDDLFAVNLFNLSGERREITGRIGLDRLGIDRARQYVMPRGCEFDVDDGVFTISRWMEPWSAEVAEVCPLPQ